MRERGSTDGRGGGGVTVGNTKRGWITQISARANENRHKKVLKTPAKR